MTLDVDAIARNVIRAWMESTGFCLFNPAPRAAALLTLARICTEMAELAAAQIEDEPGGKP